MVSSCCVKGCNSKAGQNIKFHQFPKGDLGEAWTKCLQEHNFLFKRTNSSKVCGLHFDSSLDYESSSTSVYSTERLKENAIPSIFLQRTRRPLFHIKNGVTDSNADEEIVTLSLADLLAESCEPLVSVPLVGQHFTAPPELGENPVLLADPLVSVQLAGEHIATPDFGVSPVLLADPLVSVQSAEHSATPELGDNSGLSTVKTPVSDQSSSNKKRKCFMGDFKSPSDIDSPNSRLKYWIASQSTVDNQRKRIKSLHNQTVDLKKRIITMNNLITHLKDEKKLI